MTNKKVGRNDPCPCGSGKKYKNCHMLQEKEATSAKYTAAGKRKIKAKVLSLKDKSISVFNRSATAPQVIPEPGTLDKLKFRMTKKDFRKKETTNEPPAYEVPPIDAPYEKPEHRERHLPQPGEEFKPTSEDFRKKKE